MDISDWFKIPAVISAFVVFSKFLYDIASGKRLKLREEYRFAKELLNDIKGGSLHPYAKEKGYQALVGTKNISIEEVEYILTLKEPVQCLNDYVLAREYLEKIESRGNTQLRFKAKYQSDRKRLILIIWYLFWYIAFAIIIASPCLVNYWHNFTPVDLLFLIVATFVTFAFPAWRSLKRAAMLVRGQNLVKNQRSHSWALVTQT
ncbi:hypothetical protein FG135_17940 [Vibrio cholerae]|uniref:hypothetical protein n=1 Tax=Vibrio cholerae TaxID=666 RepID=UPI00085195A5|nr:hypothetical protein [Vibrio cholerae]EGR0659763.1 hypothetical protein [Vibrio cholerae]EGR5155407.1 hypothetical protein [Vibrio cholerae]EIC9845407.1 hypothetical protein [Vibrio cholerae]EJL6329333.1 hypothetical protein [Vibrio cholerae]EJL6478138.1 hypothetical protein [Vibrio cholerae]